jgi:prophage endopeptidase
MSLFNPWVLLVSSFGGGYFKGKNDEVTRQQLEIAALNAEAREKERVLVSAIQTQATKLQKANQDAKLAQQKRNVDIDNGILKLRIPTKTSCPISTATDTTPASGDSVQATAELDREIAKSLVAITDQGDANTRQLNACIDAYNAAYQTLKGKP